MSGTQKLLAASITALALVALGVSSYLSWVTWQQSTVAGCTGGSEAGCDEVLSSSGSKWLGIPVSVLGVATYAGILALVWPATMRGGWLMTALLTVAMMAAGAGAWFIISQAFIVKHFCLYCMTVHVCGFAICTLAIVLLRATPVADEYDPMQSFFVAGDTASDEATSASPLQPVIAACIASAGLAALIAGQVLFTPSGMEIVDVPVPVPDELTVSKATEPVAEDAATVETDVTELTEDGGGQQNDTAWLEVKTEPEADPEDQPGEQASRLADEVPVEPAGDVVIATDEEEIEDSSADVTSQDEGDVTVGTAGQSFEELFGESPGDTVLTPTSTTPVPRVFRFKYLKGDIDVENNPVLGNPYARVRMVELLDYTCPHCRKMHSFIEKSVARYGDQLGVILYHVPLSRKCNQLVKLDQVSHTNACDYVRLAFGVWKRTPEKFAEFHNWLMTGDKAPPLHEAKSRAIDLAGLEVLTDKSIDVDSKSRVAEHAADMEALKVGLPALIFEGGVIKGMPNSEAEWFQVLEQRVGLKAPTQSAAN